ncbi:hypothetical protein MBANPS3_005472 [Mucor bainieri]
MSSSFANNPIQSISAFSTKSNAVTTSAAVPFETTISVASVGSSTGMPSVVVVQPSSSAPFISVLSSKSTADSLRPTPTLATGTTITDAHRNHGLSHGALAGVVVGSVIGGLMVLGLVCLLILRKKRSKKHRISYQNQEKSPLPIDILAAAPNTSQQHFRHSYRNSAMSQNSTLRSLHSQRVTNGFTPYTAPASTLTTDFSAESPSTPIIDEDFWQNSLPLGTFTIISSYTQTLDDELYIQPGDQVQMKLLFVIVLFMALLTLTSALSDHEKRRRHEHKHRGKGRRHRSSLSSKRAAQSSRRSRSSTKWSTTTTKKSGKTSSSTTTTKKSTKTATPTRTTTTKKSTTTTLTTKKAAQTSASSGGGKYSGEGTFYNVGLGSCGQTNSNSEMVAALNAPQMQNAANPNHNPQCGKSIRVTNPANGKSVTVKIVDTCPPCSSGDVDLSPKAFAAIADMDLGRIPIKWDWA